MLSLRSRQLPCTLCIVLLQSGVKSTFLFDVEIKRKPYWMCYIYWLIVAHPWWIRIINCWRGFMIHNSLLSCSISESLLNAMPWFVYFRAKFPLLNWMGSKFMSGKASAGNVTVETTSRHVKLFTPSISQAILCFHNILPTKNFSSPRRLDSFYANRNLSRAYFKATWQSNVLIVWRKLNLMLDFDDKILLFIFFKKFKAENCFNFLQLWEF